MDRVPADCKDCLTSVRHEGEPEGHMEVIGGIDCYVATPTKPYAQDKVVLYLTDVFGIPLNNNKLLPDGFANNGYKTIVPDVLNGDPVPENHEGIDFRQWGAKHGPETWIPVLDKVINALKETGVTRFATTGYCFGAIPAWHLALNNIVHVTVVTHPSRITAPGDLEKYKEASKAPLLINGCEVDQQFPKESQAIADEVFGDGKFAPGYERTYWEGCTHGFAVRGDLSDPKVKAGKEGAFEATVKFYNKYL